MRFAIKSIICIGVSVLLLLVIASIVLISLIFIPIQIEIDDMDKYLKTDGRVTDFCIFPAKDEIAGEVIDYHYRTNLFGSHEIYLEVVYSEESFENEIKRLDNLTYAVYENTFSLKKDNANLFNYTTYISVYNYHGLYEYVCIDEIDFRIVYITLEYVPADRIAFNNKYLPKTYYENEDAYGQDIDPYYYYIYYYGFDNMPDYSDSASDT